MQKYLVRFLFISCVLGVISCVGLHETIVPEEGATTDGLIIYLVRHAEKTRQVRDPQLSAAGLRRAKQLAEYFVDKQVDRIYSSNYTRTRQTAKPTAELFNLMLNLYDPRDLAGFAETLRTASGSILVVGHSNTTPQLVKLLGGDPVSEINEAKEYDRLYVLIIKSNDSVQSQLMRYGQKFEW